MEVTKTKNERKQTKEKKHLHLHGVHRASWAIVSLARIQISNNTTVLYVSGYQYGAPELPHEKHIWPIERVQGDARLVQLRCCPIGHDFNRVMQGKGEETSKDGSKLIYRKKQCSHQHTRAPAPALTTKYRNR
jgi:hypothetical protein